jgi:hypothetical protein
MMSESEQLGDVAENTDGEHTTEVQESEEILSEEQQSELPQSELPQSIGGQFDDVRVRAIRRCGGEHRR